MRITAAQLSEAVRSLPRFSDCIYDYFTVPISIKNSILEQDDSPSANAFFDKVIFIKDYRQYDWVLKEISINGETITF
jgi:hypothetical protein